MKNAYLIHHLGLGDHIICNGLVREILNKNVFNTITLPVKKFNYKSIQSMFCDLEEIILLPVDDDDDMLKKYNKIYIPIKLGFFENINFIKSNETFCKAFYRQVNISYEKRWDSFKITRNLDKEQQLRNTINHKYIFIHDDISRNLKIKVNFAHQTYRPNHSLGKQSDYTIFDYIKILEDAEEIHCIDSSFACLIDHLPQLFDKPKYIHRYIRQNSFNPYYKNKWTILYE